MSSPASQFKQRLDRSELKVRFNTPSFLGDAKQNGAWRTPPFKALLRQWWRVVYAAEQKYTVDVDQMRLTEGRLFGMAADGNGDSRKSVVQLRLKEWHEGSLDALPEVGRVGIHDPHIYLGYGPVNSERNPQGRGRRKVLVMKHGIKSEIDLNMLEVLFPSDERQDLLDTLQLVQWFGTLGGRSRNGWGSLALEGAELRDAATLCQADPLLNELARDYRHCLSLDWPHALGRDSSGLLIWRNRQPHRTWSEAMYDLASAKLEFRKVVPASRRSFGRRHILAYPITKQNVPEWDALKGRFSNQLRFKVHKICNDFVGFAFHVPCGLPASLRNTLSATDQRTVANYEADDWAAVHAALDRKMTRIN